MRKVKILFCLSLGSFQNAHGLVSPQITTSGRSLQSTTSLQGASGDIEDEDKESLSCRRDFFSAAAVASGSLLLGTSSPAAASVGTLPEFSDSDAIIQGITVNVADKSQQDAMIDFLVNSFDFQVLRKRRRDSVEETVRCDVSMVASSNVFSQSHSFCL